MGAIQSGINQSIGMASALLSINPAVQEAAKKRTELKSIDKQLSNNLELQKQTVKEGGELSELQSNFEAERVKLLEQKYRLNPTAENYRELKRATPKTIKEDPEIIQDERLEYARTEARNQAEYDFTYPTAYNKAYADLANKRAARARDTKNQLRNDYYFGGKKINDVLGQPAVDYLLNKEKENEQK